MTALVRTPDTAQVDALRAVAPDAAHRFLQAGDAAPIAANDGEAPRSGMSLLVARRTRQRRRMLRNA
ncbi:MAG: hypothetical protein AAGH87_04310 [Pseudomonadota bacterium]